MSNQTLLQHLGQEIATIKANLASFGSPVNEAQTESLIIDPLLKALGYATTDYVKRGFSSNANNFPDYTLLPSKPQRWVLEVKQFSHKLQNADEAQAAGYGFTEGTQWAVLTNGRTWYIYNVHYQKPLKDKRVLQIDDLLNNPEELNLLAHLSSHAMLHDKLTEAWTAKRVSVLVQDEIKTANSTLRTYLQQLVKQEVGLTVDDDMVGKVLLFLIDKQIVFPPPPLPNGQHTFGDIIKNPSLGIKKRPTGLTFGNNNSVSVTTWADAAKEIVATIGSQYNLPPLPFSASTKGKNYFLNTTATHGNGGKMLHFREAHVGNTKIYVDTNRSVENISACLVAFLSAVGAPLDAVKVSIP